jgi:hypothetical protein
LIFPCRPGIPRSLSEVKGIFHGLFPYQIRRLCSSFSGSTESKERQALFQTFAGIPGKDQEI